MEKKRRKNNDEITDDPSWELMHTRSAKAEIKEKKK